MASSVPTVERPPEGLDATWLGVWRGLIVEAKAAGTWSPALWPHAVEYVHALRLAREHRLLAEAEPVETNRESGLTHMHAGFADARAQGKRATELADLLGLTPRARKALALKAEEKPEEPDAFNQADELAGPRARRASVA